MKKNLISVIILALCLVNLILTAIMLFTMLPAQRKTDNLITEIGAILNLELSKSEEEEGSTGPESISDVATYNLTESATIALKSDGSGGSAYAMVGLSISMDSSQKDYADVSAKLPETESWVYDITRNVIQEYTITEVNDSEIQGMIKAEITKKLREQYQTDCIYDVTFSSFMTQQSK